MQNTVFEVLSDPTRRRVVEALQHGGRPVNELVDVVEIRQSGVSRHLRILREAGFVEVQPRAQERIYSLRPEPFRALDEWIGGYRALWEGRLARLDAAIVQRQGLRPRNRATRESKK